MLRKMRGFTLIELVVVMVIVGILSVIAVPLYRGYTRRAMAAEGKALVGSIATSEKVYLAEHGVYHAAGTIAAPINYDATIDIDARANTYFNTYSISISGAISSGDAAFTATTSGVVGGDADGITVVLDQVWNAPPTVDVTGL